MTPSKYILIIPVLFSSKLALAEDVRHHGVHEHGAAQLDVAIGSGELEIRLDSPAANIIGFEHEPRNRKQKETMHAAIDKLEAGGSLFQMGNDAGCTLRHADVDMPFGKQHASHGHSSHGHGEHAGEHADEESHADIVASWTFRCQRGEEIETIRVGLFEHFPQLKRLKVQYITDKGQGGTMLTPSKPVLTF